METREWTLDGYEDWGVNHTTRNPGRIVLTLSALGRVEVNGNVLCGFRGEAKTDAKARALARDFYKTTADMITALADLYKTNEIGKNCMAYDRHAYGGASRDTVPASVHQYVMMVLDKARKPMAPARIVWQLINLVHCNPVGWCNSTPHVWQRYVIGAVDLVLASLLSDDLVGIVRVKDGPHAERKRYFATTPEKAAALRLAEAEQRREHVVRCQYASDLVGRVAALLKAAGIGGLTVQGPFIGSDDARYYLPRVEISGEEELAKLVEALSKTVDSKSVA